MCPACIANITLLVASTASGGGLAAILSEKFFTHRKALSKMKELPEGGSHRTIDRRPKFENPEGACGANYNWGTTRLPSSQS